MEYELDLKEFCSALRESEKDIFAEKIFNTPGEIYLYQNVIQKIAADVPVRICDIDFSAFEEDDIVDLIDHKGDDIEEYLFGASLIVDKVHNSKPLTATERKFF